jgi:hypothetical protein
MLAQAVVARQTDTSSSQPLAPDYRIHADGSVTQRLCFNWSCASQQRVSFSAAEMAQVARQMDLCRGNDRHDRVQRVRIGIWQMELLAQKYQPLLANDEAINDLDRERAGRMDCIDNASNTTNYLNILHGLGLLPGWSMAAPQVRDMFSMQVHWTAVAVDTHNAQALAVDSWFRANGNLPFTMPLEDWSSGRTAWLSPFSALNPYPRYSNQLCGPQGPRSK